MSMTLLPNGGFASRFDAEGWAHEGPAWLRDLRARAMRRLATEGLPTRRTPTWEHTDASPLAGQWHAPSGQGQLDPAVLERAAFQDEQARAVLVDGRFRPELSRLADLPEGVRIAPFSADWESARQALPADDVIDKMGAVDALHIAFLGDGLRIDVDPEVVLQHPLHVVHMHTRPGSATGTRIDVRLAKGAQACLVESWVGSAPDTLSLHATQATVGAGARLQHIKQQLEHDKAVHHGTVEADVGRDGAFSGFLWSDGGRWARSGTRVRLLEPGASCSVDGLWLGRDAQVHDVPTRIDHFAHHTTSQELLKGIMDDASHGVFLGAIVVHPDAQKVDSQQTNRNLLLSPEARVDTTPQLEIHADDVKCAHGSTIGRLDPQALFFLRARGIARDRAELILTKAFAGEVLSRIGSWGIRTRLERRLENWFQRRGRA